MSFGNTLTNVIREKNSRQNKVLNRSHGPRLNVRDELLFQPWFLPKRITYKIHGLMPPQYWKKMRYYFED